MQAIRRRVDGDVSRRLFLGGTAALLAPVRDLGAKPSSTAPSHPYPHDLGVIRPGVSADILIAEGDPAQGLEFLTDPHADLKPIMKDGRVHRNAMQ